MTLVVGAVAEDGPRLWADSRLSHPHTTPHYLDGALKLLILDPELCIGYSGTYLAAVRAARDVAHLPRPYSIEAVQDRLLREQNCDFLISSLRPSSLRRVAGGTVVAGDNLWIGDLVAFTRLQELRLAEPDTGHLLTDAATTTAAMQTLIEEAQPGSVGELVISVVPEHAGFMYAPHIELTAGSQTIPSGKWTTVTFGSTVRGDFGWTLLTPQRSGVAAIGVYFIEGGLGMLLHPLVSDDPILFRSVTQDQFATRVREEFGFGVLGVKLG